MDASARDAWYEHLTRTINLIVKAKLSAEQLTDLDGVLWGLAGEIVEDKKIALASAGRTD